MPTLFLPFSEQQSSTSATMQVHFLEKREKRIDLCCYTFSKQKPLSCFQSTLKQYLMQGENKTIPNHNELLKNLTKILIPSDSPAEKCIPETTSSQLHPNSNLCLFRKNPLTCKEKNLGKHGSCTACFSSWGMEAAFLSTSHLKHTSGNELHTRLYAFTFQTLSFPLYML